MDYKKEIIKLTANEVLCSLFDVIAPFFEASPIYRKSIGNYRQERSAERSQFLEKIKYLKRRGYIEGFIENKEKFIQLTKTGHERLRELNISNIKFSNPDKWDGKWRLVIFDVPEKKRAERDIFRRKLIDLSFVQVQKSIYIYPFACEKEIENLVFLLGIKQFVLVAVSDIIEGEEKIIEKFIERGIIKSEELL